MGLSALRRSDADLPTVVLTVTDRIATLVLNRPPLNTLDADTLKALQRAAHQATERPDIRAIVIYGGNANLSAGADIRLLEALSVRQLAAFAAQLQVTFKAIADIPKPVVVAVEGYALGGGCELALTGDYRIASHNAVLGLPEVRLGLIPAAGGTQRLSRVIGVARARELILTGRQVRATEAERIGLVDEVITCSGAVARARDWAKQFASGPSYALRAAKIAVNVGADLPLDAGLHLETTLFSELAATDDRLIGTRNFIRRDTPPTPFTDPSDVT